MISHWGIEDNTHPTRTNFKADFLDRGEESNQSPSDEQKVYGNISIRPSQSPHFRWRCLYMFFILNRYFYPSTSSTTNVRADSFILERYKLCGHKTASQRCFNSWHAVSRVGNVMPCHHTGWIRQARHTHSMKECVPLVFGEKSTLKIIPGHLNGS